MLTNDPHDALGTAHERAQRLHAEAAAERLRGSSRTRRALAVFLRHAADRLEAPALNSGTPMKERWSWNH
jgi:hypothetical protein